ncbi:hypothetical protein FCR2A7T_12700 [Flavobacterium cauense R2A-7]|nr:hypothetical protein FCR2A7T_12700 [Flavobacterium cauense R2A-7]
MFKSLFAINMVDGCPLPMDTLTGFPLDMVKGEPGIGVPSPADTVT